jgi:hypothetical protein
MFIRLRIYVFMFSICLLFVSCKQKEETTVKPEEPKPALQKPVQPKGKIVSIASDFQMVNLVEVRGKTISAGMPADELFGKKIFNDREKIGTDESKDPRNPNVTLRTLRYKTRDKYITIVMAGSGDTPNYRIREIFVKNIPK